MAGAPVGGMAKIFDGVNADEARRDDVASKMTPSQIAEAQRLARKWKPK
jgi:hypothetical protein